MFTLPALQAHDRWPSRTCGEGARQVVDVDCAVGVGGDVSTTAVPNPSTQPDASRLQGVPALRATADGRSVSEGSIRLEGELHESFGHREIRRLALEVGIRDTTGLAGHAGDVEAAAAGYDGVEVVAE